MKDRYIQDKHMNMESISRELDRNRETEQEIEIKVLYLTQF